MFFNTSIKKGSRKCLFANIQDNSLYYKYRIKTVAKMRQ